MTPHFREEIWKYLGNKNFLVESKWPIADKKFLKVDKIILAIQVNGKLKDTIELLSDTSTKEIEKKVLSLPKIITILNKKKPKKIIIVKNKIANIVI